nr:unnamed protein product [Digitaria exilis]
MAEGARADQIRRYGYRSVVDDNDMKALGVYVSNLQQCSVSKRRILHLRPMKKSELYRPAAGTPRCNTCGLAGAISMLREKQKATNSAHLFARVLPSSRQCDRFFQDDLGLSLGYRLLLAADHNGWCCLATISVVWVNVGMTVLAATTTWDDLACSGSRRGAQHGWVLLVRYNIGRWRKRLYLIFWLGGSGFARGQSNEVMSA